MKKFVDKSKKSKWTWSILASLVAIIVIGLYWGNVSIQVSQYTIKSSRLPDTFSEYKIVQVSDLHNAEFGENQTRLLKEIEKQKPDCIAVTGDLIDSSHTDIETAMKFIRGAVELAPVYYVTGNHEAWTSAYEDLREKLQEAGVTVLADQTVLLSKDGQKIQLLGVNDPDFSHTTDAPQTISSKLSQLIDEKEQYQILLSHRPELYDVYVKKGIDLVLTGHAHGGQFRIPFIGGLVAPDQGFFPKYAEGVVDGEQTKMVVSRGLGNSIIPIRINNRPELAVVTLVSELKGEK